jgi:hypothetical protein
MGLAMTIAFWSGYFMVGFLVFIVIIHKLMQHEERITDVG